MDQNMNECANCFKGNVNPHHTFADHEGNGLGCKRQDGENMRRRCDCLGFVAVEERVVVGRHVVTYTEIKGIVLGNTEGKSAYRKLNSWLKNNGIKHGPLRALANGELPADLTKMFERAMKEAGKVLKVKTAARGTGIAAEPVFVITDDVLEVTECKHVVAELREVVARAQGIAPVVAAAPKPRRFYCAGCKRVGRGGAPGRHHTVNMGPCDAHLCKCLAFEQGEVYPELPDFHAPRRCPDRIEVNGKTYKQLGMGASRVVYDMGCGTHAIKIAYDAHDRFPFQMEAEIKFWERADAAIRKFLPPIFAVFPDRKATIVQKADMKRPDDPMAEMLRVARNQGMADMHEANIGWHNGQPVILDFGFAPGTARRRGLGR